MENPEEELSLAIFNKPKYRLTNSSGWFEIRLFYVRVSPCAADCVPDHLTVNHLRREIGVSMEVNGVRVPATETASLTLRRDRLDKESSEVTYVSTDCVKVTGSVEFEVCEGETMMICGSLERMDAAWSNGDYDDDDGNDDDGDDDLKTGWGMDCYTSGLIMNGGSVFVQPKIGISAPSFEVYIAGCCSGVPVILTKMIQISPRRKPTRLCTLDAIPEDVEIGKAQERHNGLVQRKLQITEIDVENYESNGKHGSSCYYTEDMYVGEDGQLSWFNAGVRVGVGIGLGMCLGLGIGVGVLMRSYQSTTRNLRRKFF